MNLMHLDLLDDQACYEFLVKTLHPDGLRCPDCGGGCFGVHRSRREPVRDYRCCTCGRVFNAWTGTALQGTQRRPWQLVKLLRGIARATPTARLALELECSRRHLLDLRRRLRHWPGLTLPVPEAGAERGPAVPPGWGKANTS